MIWVEFLGGVGSGKSSLAAALKERLRADGIVVSSPQEAVAATCLNTVSSFRVLTKAVQFEPALRAARKLMFAGWQIRFSVKNLSLIRQVIQANRALQALPGWHRKIILGLFFETAGWYEVLVDRSDSHEVVLVEEGLAHRAVNLFAWRTGAINEQAIRAYLKRLPAVPVTILVNAPVSACLQRANSRGLPARLRGKDPTEVQHFIQNSHVIATLAGSALASLGQRVIEVDNGAAVEQAAAALYSKVTESGLLHRETFSQIHLVKELSR